MYHTDMDKLEVAIRYVQRIADGCNPVNNMPVEDDSVMNNPNVIRCMFFIKEVLEEVRRNKGVIGGRKAREKGEPFPFEVLEGFRYESDKPITHLLRQLRSLTDREDVEKLSYRPVSDWLKTAGYLTRGYSQEAGREVTMPTEKGRKLGIYTDVRIGSTGSYLCVLYNQNAQEYIVRNFEAILSGQTEEDMK